MGNKTTIIGMLVLAVLCMGYWFFLVHYVYPKHPEWVFTPPPASEPSQPENSSVGPASAFSPATTTSSISPGAGSVLRVVATQPAQGPQTIGSNQFNDPAYALGLEIAPAGAGLNSVTINSYKDADAKGLYIFQQPETGYESELSLATRAITIDGQSTDLKSVNWHLEPGATIASATYDAQIVTAGNSPLLLISKTYQLIERGPKKNRDNTAAGYEATVTYHLQNLTKNPLGKVRLEFDGPTMPEREMERTDDRQIVAGYDKGNDNVDVTRSYLGEFKPGAEDKDLSINGNEKFLWAGTSSNYFSAIVLPDKQGLIDKVQAHCHNVDAPSDERIVSLDFQTVDFPIGSGASIDLPLHVFLGPKERDLLEGDYYGLFPRQFNQLLASSSGFCGICALPKLVDGLVDLLRVFHWVLHDWGLSIIALVVLVRLILHPISKSSQVSMLKLQKMGPELERLKKKYTNDKDGLAKAQMEMHKEMGITPFLGCLPMFLQMPIWIALYSALQNDIVLRQAPFLWGFTWIHDLARPDRLITWQNHPFTVPFIGMKLVSLNILPLIVAGVMFYQQVTQPQPPTMTPEQASQQKMMRYMSLAFSLFFYWMPSGLNLYIMTSSTIAIFESKRIRAHIKEIEEREKGNKVIVDAKPTRQGKQKLKKDSSAPASKPGVVGGWWARLQEKAEEIRREAERKNKK